MSKIVYRDYIVSPEWRGKHKEWLKKLGNRCAFTLLPLKRYNMHHLTYENLGDERYGRDVLPSAKWFHNLVIHGILSGFKSAGKQKTPYPNQAQRIVHNWGRLPYQLKKFILIALAASILTAPISLALSGINDPQTPAITATTATTPKVWATSTQFVIRSAKHRISKV